VKSALDEAYRVDDTAAQDLEGISKVHSASGQYNLLMKCYLLDGEDIGRFVTGRFQRLPSMKDTFTIITFRAF
jgi:DNA-binding Lrp family transcriptional regulator